MQCPRCEHEHPAGQRFCGECGARLSIACAACGAVNPPGSQLCGQCGAAPVSGPIPATFGSPVSYTPKRLAEKILTSRSALEGERKQVTVLFADMKGSLELLADRDPEEARKLLDPVLQHMMDAVHRYEGMVNQVMGDGIMALFGAPVAHEDHAIRACYAALAMQDSIRRYTEVVRRSHGVELQIRVGLNSGEVVVRVIDNDLRTDYTAVGQTTHLSARMEQLASPGTTRLTAETARLAEGFVQVKPLGPVPIKGLESPIEVYELVGAVSVHRRLEASAMRGFTRFVGRAAELDRLVRALERARVGEGQAVAVVGEPGVGKSRLFWEFASSHRTRGALVLGTGAVSYGKAIPFRPVIDLLKNYFTIDATDAGRRIRERITGKLLTLDHALEATLPEFHALLDAPVEHPQWDTLDSSERRQRTLDAIARLLFRESQVQPLVLVFEDLHWVDSETQALLDTLVQRLPTARILLLVNYRPEYRHRWTGKSWYTELRVDPLSPEGAAELLDALVGDHPTLRPLKRLLIERTEGNPFFLEESVRDLIETRILTGERGAHQLAKPVQSVQVPATVHAVLAARIDRLPLQEKQLLQTAAVIGKDVPFALLRAVAELPEEALRQGCARLQVAELLYETSGYPEPTYTFTHTLTHEVAYGTLVRSRRQALHSAVGRTLETLYAGRLDEVVDRLAHHYSKTEEAAKALDYLVRFARKAARQHSHVEAVAAIQEASEHARRLPADAQENLAVELALRQAQSLNFLGRNEESLELLGRQRARVDALGDPSRAARYYFALGITYWFLARNEDAVQSFMRTVEEATRAGDERTLGRAYALLTLESFRAGRPAEGIEASRHAVALLERTRQPYWLGLAHFYAASVHYLTGDIAEGLAAAARADAIGGMIASALIQSLAAAAAGVFHTLAGDWRTGVAAGQRALDLSPDPVTTATVLGLLGYAHLEAGDATEAVRRLEEAAQRAHHLRYRQNEAWFKAFLAEAYRVAGDSERARELADQSLELSRSIKFGLAVGLGERTLGRIAWAARELDEAERRLGEALHIFVSIGARFEEARTHLDLVPLARAQRSPTRTETHLARARQLFQALGAVRYAAWTERLAEDPAVPLPRDAGA